MPKRLLRYALSRLEFLDTEALDIDKLDFTVGKNSVVTFQDVPIKLQARNPMSLYCRHPCGMGSTTTNHLSTVGTRALIKSPIVL